MSVVNLFDGRMSEDLINSGLTVQDIKARSVGTAERASANIPSGVDGYVIPYYALDGRPLPFYRVRLYDHDPKYKQILNSPNHVYFPPKLHELLTNKKHKYILLTEGEKKAAAAVKAGFPCVALSGVDSWRNRTIVIPKDARVAQTAKGDIVARLKGPAQVTEKLDDLATGFEELVNLCVRKQLTIIICYDVDTLVGTSANVQRAAAVLGYELRFRGLPFKQIKQLHLKIPEQEEPRKVGLDDFLVDKDLGASELHDQIEEVLADKSAFPRHPNPKEYVNKKLQKTNMSRQDVQNLATSILCDLDTKGVRLRNPNDDSLYYFDKDSHKLLKVVLDVQPGFAKAPFSVLLYKEYNLGAADFRLLQWLNTLYSGEEPVVEAYPERVMKLKGDALFYQLNDGEMVKVTAEGVQVIQNGEENVLFEAGAVSPLTRNALGDAVKEQLKKPLHNIWYDVLKDARIADSPDDNSRRLLSLLYHISPWFYRWRGTQLPIEMTCGEPGAGKSTLYQLRLDILTGDPILRNAPKDIRDWTASVAASGGMHVTDNVHMANGAFKQELSDEYCRIVTEPNPFIERRKLYSDNDLVRTPVRAVFAVTAVKQPFTNPDIIQRSVITMLDKGVDVVKYDAEWEPHQLQRFGGRAGWLAHQFVFQRKMFQLIKKKWDSEYKAAYRLINVEQLLCFAAEVFGWDSRWIPNYLENTRDAKTASSDWALQGICAWAESMRIKTNRDATIERIPFSTKSIAEWAMGEEEFDKCELLINPRMLGKYLQTNRNMVSQIAGVEDTGIIKNNVKVLRVRREAPIPYTPDS